MLIKHFTLSFISISAVCLVLYLAYNTHATTFLVPDYVQYLKQIFVFFVDST